MIIEFFATSIFWLALWALREVERHRRFKKLAEENEALRAVNEERARQIETLKARESHQQLVIGAQRAKLEQMLAKLKADVSEKALPPASAKAAVAGAAVNLHPLTVQVTTGLPVISSPAFLGRQQ